MQAIWKSPYKKIITVYSKLDAQFNHFQKPKKTFWKDKYLMENLSLRRISDLYQYCVLGVCITVLIIMQISAPQSVTCSTGLCMDANSPPKEIKFGSVCMNLGTVVPFFIQQ